MPKKMRLGFAACRIWLLMQLDFKNSVTGTMLPPNQLRSLEYICLHPECSQNDVAEYIQLTPAAVANIMKKLCALGYVERIACPNNLRANSLVATAEGIQIAKTCGKIFDEEEAKLTKGFTEKEREELSGYIRRILQNLESSSTNSLAIPELARLVMDDDYLHEQEFKQLKTREDGNKEV